jgi:hypothetical protein
MTAPARTVEVIYRDADPRLDEASSDQQQRTGGGSEPSEKVPIPVTRAEAVTARRRKPQPAVMHKAPPRRCAER